MNLPKGEDAVIDERKIWGYLLNPNHEHGRSHAYLLKHLLDIDLSNWKVLRDALQSAACEGEAIEGRSSSYGRKYEVRFTMSGSRGEFTVLSVWILPGDPASAVGGPGTPHLVTAYIE